VWATARDSGRQVSKDQVLELREEITVVDLRQDARQGSRKSRRIGKSTFLRSKETGH
jgi:hypothetical protein